MERKKKNASWWRLLWISLLLCLCSAVVTHVIATDGGKVSVKNIDVITESGYKLATDMYVPKEASKEHKLPAIVVMHGGNNAKEQIAHYALELSRRGYVVVNADMYGHGESERLPDSTWLTAGRGLYDAVRYTATLPFVDVNRIGVVGYSRGARACGECMALDNAAANSLGKRLISTMYLIHSDPVYKDNGIYCDVYGSRDIGVNADKYDEFFYSEKAEVSGTTYNAEANRYAVSSTTPVDYIINPSAQSFLYFGQDPATTSGKRLAETVYSKDFPDKQGTRIINVTNETHMCPWFSAVPMRNTIRFFARVMPTDTEIPTDSMIFPVSFFFSLVGLVGLLGVLISIAMLLADEAPFFHEIALGRPQLAHVADRKGVAWFWALQIACTICGIFVLWLMNKLRLSTFKDAIFRSSIPLFHGILCLLCGMYTILACVIWYVSYGKKHGFFLASTGFGIPWRSIGKSFLAAFLAVCSLVLVASLAKWMFATNYLFIYWGFMAFDADRLVHMLIILPFFVCYYGAMSFAVNCFNFNDVVGKKQWLNGLILAFIASIPTLFVIVYVYGVYRATNWNPNFGGMASAPTWIIAMPLIIFTFILISRFVYERTGNPYVSAFLTGILGSVASWTVAEIRIPETGAAFHPSLKITLLLVVGFGVSIACFSYLRKQTRS